MGGGSLIMSEIMSFIEREAPPDSYVNLMADVDGFYEKWGFEKTSPRSKGMALKVK